MTTEYKLVNKSQSKFMKLLSYLLFFNKDFMSGYITTVGRTIYAPRGFIDKITLAHELVHVADYNKYGILFYLSYLFCLPAVWTMRSFWEKRAYRVTIQLTYQEAPRDAMSAEFKEWICSQFTGSNYLYMNPFKKSVEAWFDSVIKELAV